MSAKRPIKDDVLAAPEIQIIRDFVRRSGGIHGTMIVKGTLLKIFDAGRAETLQQFLRNMSKRRDTASAICTLALVGAIMTEAVHKACSRVEGGGDV